MCVCVYCVCVFDHGVFTLRLAIDILCWLFTAELFVYVSQHSTSFSLPMALAKIRRTRKATCSTLNRLKMFNIFRFIKFTQQTFKPLMDIVYLKVSQQLRSSAGISIHFPISATTGCLSTVKKYTK